MDYGGENIQFRPFAEDNPEPEGKMPNYGEPITIGELNQVNDTLDYNEVSAYGDNERRRYLRKIRSVGVQVQVLDVSNKNMAVLLGTELDENGALRIGSGNKPPYGAVTFIRNVLLENDEEKFKGMIYPKVKAAMEGRTYNTNGENITLTGQGINFSGGPCKSGDTILISPDFDTKAEVEAWFEQELGVAG